MSRQTVTYNEIIISPRWVAFLNIGIEGVSHLTPAFHRIRARQISPSHGSYCSLRLECHHRKSNLEHSGSIWVWPQPCFLDLVLVALLSCLILSWCMVCCWWQLRWSICKFDNFQLLWFPSTWCSSKDSTSEIRLSPQWQHWNFCARQFLWINWVIERFLSFRPIIQITIKIRFFSLNLKSIFLWDNYQ